MQEATRHVLVWGALRFVLGVAQMTLAPLAVVALVAAGLDHWLTLALVAGATGATITSRLLYGGRPDPKLGRRDAPPDS